MLRNVCYVTKCPLGCDCDASLKVILCLDDNQFIEANIIGKSINLDCADKGWLYTYTFQYNDQSIPLDDPIILPTDIEGIICQGCLTSWIKSLIQTPVTVVDTESIDLTATEVAGTYQLQADLIVSPQFANLVQVLPDGVFVSPLLQLDSESVDITIVDAGVTRSIKADVLISSQVGNTLQILPDGLFTIGGGTPANPDTSVQFNNAGAFGGDSDFTYDSVLNELNINGHYNLGGNVFISRDGVNNTFIGHGAGLSAGASNNNTFLGRLAGNDITGNFNTAIGSSASENSVAVDSTVAIGRAALINNTVDNTIGIGSLAGQNNQGVNNIFIGFNAGLVNTTGIDCVFIGAEAGLAATIGNNNTFIGAIAGQDHIDGENNTFVGRAAGAGNTTGDNNTFVGQQTGGRPFSGNNNSLLGRLAGTSLFTGNNNTLLGAEAGSAVNTGENNILIGYAAGQIFSSGSNNIFLGANANANSALISNSGAFGRGALVTANNQFVAGAENFEFLDWYIGAGIVTPTKVSVTFQSSGGSGLDKDGSDFILSSGQGTGTGDGGVFKVRYAPASGVSGSGLNAYTDVITLDANGLQINSSSTQELGFWGASPIARNNGWSVTNVVSTKTFDASAAALADIRNVLGTLIEDVLKIYGLLGA